MKLILALTAALLAATCVHTLPIYPIEEDSRARSLHARTSTSTTQCYSSTSVTWTRKLTQVNSVIFAREVDASQADTEVMSVLLKRGRGMGFKSLFKLLSTGKTRNEGLADVGDSPALDPHPNSFTFEQLTPPPHDKTPEWTGSRSPREQQQERDLTLNLTRKLRQASLRDQPGSSFRTPSHSVIEPSQKGAAWASPPASPGRPSSSNRPSSPRRPSSTNRPSSPNRPSSSRATGKPRFSRSLTSTVPKSLIRKPPKPEEVVQLPLLRTFETSVEAPPVYTQHHGKVFLSKYGASGIQHVPIKVPGLPRLPRELNSLPLKANYVGVPDGPAVWTRDESGRIFLTEV